MTDTPVNAQDSAEDDQASAEGSDSTETRTPEEIEADLEQTRRELGETVDALSAKLDVKSRARDQVDSTKRAAGEQLQTLKLQATDLTARGRDAATDQDGNLKPALPIGAGAIVLLAGGITILVISRRRRRRMLVPGMAYGVAHGVKHGAKHGAKHGVKRGVKHGVKR